MALVNLRTLLKEAQVHGYAVLGVAVYNMETIRTAITTAEQLDAPIILQTTGSTIDYAGLRYLSAAVRAGAEHARVPVVLQLDHGASVQRAQECLDQGYTSVMIDASREPWEANCRVTASVVRLAQAYGASVEAELGQVGGVEDDHGSAEGTALLTDPDQACAFVEQTGVDALAVAIGSAHGLYRRPPDLRFDLLAKIRSVVPVPLVLHGASGLSDEAIRRAVQGGIAKVNIASELKAALATALRTHFASQPQVIDPRVYFQKACQAYADVVRERLHVTGSAHQARPQNAAGSVPTTAPDPT